MNFLDDKLSFLLLNLERSKGLHWHSLSRLCPEKNVFDFPLLDCLHFLAQPAETGKTVSCKQYRASKKLLHGETPNPQSSCRKNGSQWNSMYRKRNDAIVFFLTSDTALNWHIRSKFIYELLHLERNNKKHMQICYLSTSLHPALSLDTWLQRGPT